MSQSTTNTPYMIKSMNSIIVLDDGAGGSMENGVITCNELDVPIINCNEVQPYNVSSGYNLFTTAPADINIGNIGVVVYMLSPMVSATAIIAGQFNSNLAYLNNIESQTINASTLNISVVNVSTVTVDTTNITTLNAFVGNIQTVNSIIINASTINASTINSNTLNSFDVGSPSSLFPNALTDVGIADGLTAGTLSMGSLLQTGEINIGGSNMNSGSINIGREMNGGTMRFASNAQATSIFWGNDANSGTVNFNTNTSMILGPYAKNITLGSNTSGGTIQIGVSSVNTSTAIGGSNIAIGANVSAVTDRINIGNSTVGSSGTINIFSRNTINVGLNASSIQIGNGMPTGGNINLGNSAIQTVVNGSTVFIGNGTSVGKITVGNATMTGEIELATDGNLTLGTTANNINMGTGMPSGFITLGNNTFTGEVRLRTTGTMQLGNSASVINMGATANISNGLFIGNASSSIAIDGTTIGIGDTTVLANAISIGNVSSTINTNALITSTNASFINIGAATGTNTINIGNVSTPSLTLNTPINPNYDTKYTAFVGTPTGCIGNSVAPTTFGANFALTSTVSRTANTFTDLPIGVYILYWNITFYVPTTAAVITRISAFMGTNPTNTDIFSAVIESATTTFGVGVNKNYLVTQFYTNTLATGDVYLRIEPVFTGTLTLLSAVSTKDCKAVRIA